MNVQMIKNIFKICQVGWYEYEDTSGHTISSISTNIYCWKAIEYKIMLLCCIFWETQFAV